MTSQDDHRGGGAFPTTHRSAITGFHSDDAEERARSFDALVRTYWRPVYKHVRLKWGRGVEDAQDLTQAFFARALEKEFFAGYDPRRGRFRTYLRVCLDGFVANEFKAASRLKRGGGVELLPLDFETAEGEVAATQIASPDSVERCFDEEWARSLFRQAIEALRGHCAESGRTIAFSLFEAHDLDPPPGARLTYEELAGRFGIPVTQVNNHLSWARRELRRLLLESLRNVTASDEEYRREARALLGGEPE